MAAEGSIDHERLLKLRLAVARHGEMDRARWWKVNSAPFDALVKLAVGRTGAGVQFMPGMRANAPVPSEIATDQRLADAFRRGYGVQYARATFLETSHAFILPSGLNEKATGFEPSTAPEALARIQGEIDGISYYLYGISDEDRATIEAPVSGGPSSASAADGAQDESAVKDDDSDEDDCESSVELATTTLTTYSWLVGVAFGRFDPRLATGKRAIPPEPEPFDPLPARSPGMWPEGEEPDTVPPDLMVDDAGHDHDICALVANAAALTG